MQNFRNNLKGPAGSNSAAILFDCDGVLCQSWRFANLLSQKHNITLDMTKDYFHNEFPKALTGTESILNQLPNYLNEWGWTGTVEDFISTWLESEKEVRGDVLELVCDLRNNGYIVGLATNQEHFRASYMKTHMNFLSIFDHCFISSELGCMKPELSYFDIVTKSLSLAPEHIVFIDDEEKNISQASSYGWKTILFQNADLTKKELIRNGICTQ